MEDSHASSWGPSVAAVARAAVAAVAVAGAAGAGAWAEKLHSQPPNLPPILQQLFRYWMVRTIVKHTAKPSAKYRHRSARVRSPLFDGKSIGML